MRRSSISPLAPAVRDEAPPAIKDLKDPVIHVVVADNGRGFPDGVKPSYGISGMSERVWATGGEMRLSNRPGGGAALNAWIPVPAVASDRDVASRATHGNDMELPARRARKFGSAFLNQ